MKDGSGAFNKMSYVDRAIVGRIAEKEGSVEERAEKMMAKVEDEIAGHDEAKKYMPRAEELLNEYGSSDEIPKDELERDLGKLDDGKLLAYIKHIENKRAKDRKKMH